jgi:hypothetical protein
VRPVTPAISRVLAATYPGLLAGFERDTIVDRVIADMERKAAARKWKDGRRSAPTPVTTRQRLSRRNFRPVRTA